jgi:hypothetical protein
MHHPARCVIEGIAPVHGRTIVPEDEITNPPVVLITELWRIHEPPQLIEQCI